MGEMTKEQVLHVLLAWLGQRYPADRVPLGLVERAFAGSSLGVDRSRVADAAREGIARHLLKLHGQSSDGLVVSLEPAGLEMAGQLLGSFEQQIRVGSVAAAADQLLAQIVGAFENTLRRTAIEWATSAGSDVEPVHIVLAARSLAAGPLLAAIEEIDAKRDKSNDAAAEQKLLALLWKQEGSS